MIYRIGALNIRHGGGRRREDLAKAIIGWAVDAVVLGEWSPNGTPSMRGLLEEGGLTVIEAVPSLPSREYGVAIAARAPVQEGALSSRVDPSRMVHVHLGPMDAGCDLIGLYVPSGSPDIDRKNAFLAEMTELSQLLRTHGAPIVLAGDLNGDHVHATGAKDTRLVGSAEFATFHAAGWRDPFLEHGRLMDLTWVNPQTGGRGFRLDHVWVRGEVDVPAVEVLHHLDGRRLHHAADGEDDPLTDHAALEVQISYP